MYDDQEEWIEHVPFEYQQEAQRQQGMSSRQRSERKKVLRDHRNHKERGEAGPKLTYTVISNLTGLKKRSLTQYCHLGKFKSDDAESIVKFIITYLKKKGTL